MVRLTQLDESHHSAFEELLREMWQQNWCNSLAKAIVQWRYYDRPNGATWLAMEGDQCVGMLDSMLRLYLLNGQRILVRETADWYCTPNQRQSVLGLRLLRHLKMYSEPVFVLGGSSSTLQILSKMREWKALPCASSYVLPLKARALAANLIRQKWWRQESFARVVPEFLPFKKPRHIGPPTGHHGTTRLMNSFDMLPPPDDLGLVQLFESAHWAWLVKMPAELARPIGVQFFLDDILVGFSLSQIEPAATGLDARIMYVQAQSSCAAWVISETTRILADHGAGFVRCCVSTPDKISAMETVGYIKTRDVACHWWSQAGPTPAMVDVGYLRGDDAIPFQALRGRMIGAHA